MTLFPLNNIFKDTMEMAVVPLSHIRSVTMGLCPENTITAINNSYIYKRYYDVFNNITMQLIY
jgi:hypothetical protein